MKQEVFNTIMLISLIVMAYLDIIIAPNITIVVIAVLFIIQIWLTFYIEKSHKKEIT